MPGHVTCLNKIDYYLNMLLFIETVSIFTVLLDIKENISREQLKDGHIGVIFEARFSY